MIMDGDDSAENAQVSQSVSGKTLAMNDSAAKRRYVLLGIHGEVGGAMMLCRLDGQTGR